MCVCVCVCVCVGGTKKENQNGDHSQRHKMAESQNSGHDLLESDVTECSVKRPQENKRKESNEQCLQQKTNSNEKELGGPQTLRTLSHTGMQYTLTSSICPDTK